jgi:hypothetical protein
MALNNKINDFVIPAESSSSYNLIYYGVYGGNTGCDININGVNVNMGSGSTIDILIKSVSGGTGCYLYGTYPDVLTPIVKNFNLISLPVTYGDYLVGGTGIIVTDGVYDQIPTISYQWKRDGVDISGATTNTYTPLLTDENKPITCLVTASYSGEILENETAPFTLKAGLLFNTSLNNLDFGSNQTTGNDWTVTTRFDRLNKTKDFFLLGGTSATGLRFEGSNFILNSSGVTYSSAITSGAYEDVRQFLNGNNTWEFIKSGTTLTCKVNGQLLKAITVGATASLTYRRIGRWNSNNAYDFDGVLDYININGTLYNSLNNWGGLIQSGVTKTQIYYGEMEDSFFLGGQSNAVARNNEADNAYLGINFPIEKSKYWNSSASTYQDTIFGVNQATDYGGNWGVEFRNAYNLSQENRQNYLLKYAIGGTSMATTWILGSYTLAKLMSRTGRAFKNFIWIQGETDSTNLTWANAYQANLIEFIRRVRMYSTYGDDLKFIIFRLPDITRPEYLYVSTIQAAQDYVAANVPNVELITAPIGWSTLDGEHYDAPTIDAIGAKIFEQLQVRTI